MFTNSGSVSKTKQFNLNKKITTRLFLHDMFLRVFVVIIEIFENLYFTMECGDTAKVLVAYLVTTLLQIFHRTCRYKKKLKIKWRQNVKNKRQNLVFFELVGIIKCWDFGRIASILRGFRPCTLPFRAYCCHTGTALISPERQSAQMSKITNDGLTRSGTGCIIAVPVWQQ